MTSAEEPPVTRFGIVGGGWWAEMYLRIAASLTQFEVTGMVVRREEAGRVLEDQWGVRTFRTVEDMTTALSGSDLLFIVIAVPQPANAAMLQAVVESGVPALGQTPSGWTLEECIELHESVTLAGKRVQIAEQYHMQPIHQARLALISSGALGEITQAQVSVATACKPTPAYPGRRWPCSLIRLLQMCQARKFDCHCCCCCHLRRPRDFAEPNVSRGGRRKMHRSRYIS